MLEACLRHDVKSRGQAPFLSASGKTRAVHFDVVHHVADVFRDDGKDAQRRMLSDLTRPLGSKKPGHPRRHVEDVPSAASRGFNVAIAMLFTPLLAD